MATGMLEQTKAARQALMDMGLRARRSYTKDGIKWAEFRVSTSYNRQYGYYEDTLVVLDMPLGRQFELVDDFAAAGFDVTRVYLHGKEIHPIVKWAYGDTGKVSEWRVG